MRRCRTARHSLSWTSGTLGGGAGERTELDDGDDDLGRDALLLVLLLFEEVVFTASFGFGRELPFRLLATADDLAPPPLMLPGAAGLGWGSSAAPPVWVKVGIVALMLTQYGLLLLLSTRFQLGVPISWVFVLSRDASCELCCVLSRLRGVCERDCLL